MILRVLIIMTEITSLILMISNYQNSNNLELCRTKPILSCAGLF